MELEIGQKIAEAVIKQLRPYCSEIKVAGSIRRQKPLVHDIDIVLIPLDHWGLEAQVLSLAHPFRPKLSGERLKRFSFNGAQIDLYYAAPETWATLLLIRTGSKENNIRLTTLAKKRGWRLHASGEGLFDENGQKIAGASEESIYQALGLSWQSPWERD